MTFRIGNGYDVHRFADTSTGKDDFITLAGVKIPYEYCLLAHSDGDVAIHALCDALLGALALGDIGQHFPDTDAQYKNIDSLLLLQHVYTLITKQGWALVNADLTIIAQKPKMAPHIPLMRRQLTKTLAVDISQLSIKATTTEGLGFTGREEGIAVSAVILLQAIH